MPSGGKHWRFKYRFGYALNEKGEPVLDKKQKKKLKEKRISLGAYPEVTLKLARERRDEMRKLLAEKIDPSIHRKVNKEAALGRAANSFEAVAREWFTKHLEFWVQSHSDKIIRRLERDIFPWIGERPVAEIKPSEILSCIRRIEKRGVLETAHRALQNCGQVMKWAVQTGRAERDVTADLRGALPPVRAQHFAAITEPKQVGDLLRAIDGFEGTFVVQCALKIAPLVFVRPGELRKAKWADMDLDVGEWRFDVTKTRTKHIVPLAHQVVEILRELHPLTGHSEFVFPGERSTSRPMSDAAINAALRRLGYAKDQMSGHGFRALARTILDEVLGYPAHLIEHQLAHAVRDPNGRAYNRTAHLPQRHEMMSAWADYLDGLKAGGEILSIKRKANE